MPLYEYQCDGCGARFELIRKFSDPPLSACPTCGSDQVQKLISSPAFQFKGSGWYITDYARKPEGSTSDKSGAGEKNPDTGAKPDAAKPAGETAAGDKAAPAAAPATPVKDKPA